MNIKPLGNRVVVKAYKEDEITKSGIVLPDTVDKKEKSEGEILAIGDGEKIQKLSLSVGDKVIFSKYGGSEINVDKEEYKILGDDDLLAVVKEGVTTNTVEGNAPLLDNEFSN